MLEDTLEAERHSYTQRHLNSPRHTRLSLPDHAARLLFCFTRTPTLPITRALQACLSQTVWHHQEATVDLAQRQVVAVVEEAFNKRERPVRQEERLPGIRSGQHHTSVYDR
jgi:hypothetical protein